MEDYPLVIFAENPTPLPLNILFDALVLEGHPVHFSFGIAGEATAADLASTEWDTAFLRWTEPELHEICLLEAISVTETEAQETLNSFEKLISKNPDKAGQLIVQNQLRQTKTIYGIQLLPALIENEDHLAWEALDLLARSLAQNTDGMIYAEAEGFCDAEGELMLAE